VLPSGPNQSVPIALREGDTGWPIYALQSGLNTLLGAGLKKDGDFGAKTTKKVRAWQKRIGLGPDGVAGVMTMSTMATALAKDADGVEGVPDGLARSLMDGESAYNFGAVNWNVGGGVDVSLMQHRVFGPPYDLERLRFGYSPARAIRRAMANLLDAADDFEDGPWVLSLPRTQRREACLRLGLMAHNWPHQGGADYIAIHGKCSSPDRICTWLPRHDDGTSKVKFPDGTLVNTRWEWCQFYAMGSPRGPARMTRFVKDWAR
jgi:peptidoglycan hydrolase-like protein with peptidoglycan-binding domain